MKLIFDRSFNKSLDKLNDVQVKSKIEQVIFEAEAAEFFSEIANVKKMQGFKNFYRIRIGDYRLGVELEEVNTVRFILVLHRKKVYKKFP